MQKQLGRSWQEDQNTGIDSGGTDWVLLDPPGSECHEVLVSELPSSCSSIELANPPLCINLAAPSRQDARDLRHLTNRLHLLQETAMSPTDPPPRVERCLRPWEFTSAQLRAASSPKCDLFLKKYTRMQAAASAAATATAVELAEEDFHMYITIEELTQILNRETDCTLFSLMWAFASQQPWTKAVTNFCIALSNRRKSDQAIRSTLQEMARFTRVLVESELC